MTAITIMKRELKAYFTAPVAYIVTALFLIVSGILFFSTFFLYDRAELRQYFSLLPVLLSFFIPALTMRIFAEERRVGSIETLMTLPVTEADVVTGKYLASDYDCANFALHHSGCSFRFARLRSDCRRICRSNFPLCKFYCNWSFCDFSYKKSDYRILYRFYYLYCSCND